ncbi:MAG TPA: hypothetical protein DD473_25460 [Planctomycetaceae bacterium]|nr:hypothetical protein [Planctomycetaceae bacterium]
MTAIEMCKLLSAILIKKGMYAVESDIVAQRMIDADIMGRSEFGCLSIIESVKSIDLGDIDPRALSMIKSDTPATAWIDANEGMGHVAASKGSTEAVQKAKAVGIGAVVISNSQNLGSPLVYARLIAQAGMIGCCLTCPPASPAVEDELEEQTFFGRQPAAFAVPAHEATIGYEFSFGADRPLRHQIPAELSTSLGLLQCLLTSGLSGAKTPPEKTRGPLHERFEHFIIAIDPAAFAGPEKLAKTVESLVKHVDSQENSPAYRAAITESPFLPEESTLLQINELAERLRISNVK